MRFNKGQKIKLRSKAEILSINPFCNERILKQAGKVVEIEEVKFLHYTIKDHFFMIDEMMVEGLASCECGCEDIIKSASGIICFSCKQPKEIQLLDT